MAETVHLFLKAGDTDIKGDSSQTSLGREDSIECTSFESIVKAKRDAASGMATGRRVFDPLLIRKRIDKATPLISKAMCNNEKIHGVFRFFRPNPAGDGTTEQFFTVEIDEGRIAGQKIVSPDVMRSDEATDFPLEEVTFTFNKITWTHEPKGPSHVDSWREGQ